MVWHGDWETCLLSSHAAMASALKAMLNELGKKAQLAMNIPLEKAMNTAKRRPTALPSRRQILR